jgi:hypothetical protein
VQTDHHRRRAEPKEEELGPAGATAAERERGGFVPGRGEWAREWREAVDAVCCRGRKTWVWESDRLTYWLVMLGH